MRDALATEGEAVTLKDAVALALTLVDAGGWRAGLGTDR